MPSLQKDQKPSDSAHLLKPRVTDLLLYDILAVLQKTAADPKYAVESTPLAAQLAAALRNRMAGNTRKGNPKGGSGRPADWWILEDEEKGTLPFAGIAALAQHIDRNASALSVSISRNPKKQWCGTRQTTSGEWALLARKATEQEAAELTAENGE